MTESDALETSSEKWVVFHKTMGRNSNGDWCRGSGTTSSTKEEAFSHASVKSGCTVVTDWADLLSCNVTADVRRATAPSCTGVLHDTSSANGAGLRLCNWAIGFQLCLIIVLRT